MVRRPLPTLIQISNTMIAPMTDPMMPEVREAGLRILAEDQIAEESADEQADDAKENRHQMKMSCLPGTGRCATAA